MMELVISGNIGGAVVSFVFWIAAAYLVTPRIRLQPLVHRALVYLVIAAFVLLDVFTVGASLRLLDQSFTLSLYSFLNGLQITAAIAAVIFVRGIPRRAA